MDWLPIISQLKSLVQFVARDQKGSFKTCKIFSQTCPIISQIRSAVEANAGDFDAARQTQVLQLQMIKSLIDQIPVLGHLKGVFHYAVGDPISASLSFKAASTTIGVAGAGVGGALIGGYYGAILCGVAGGLVMDTLITGVDSKIHGKYSPSGEIKAVTEIVKDAKKNVNVAGKTFDAALMLILNGFTGFQAGNSFLGR